MTIISTIPFFKSRNAVSKTILKIFHLFWWLSKNVRAKRDRKCQSSPVFTTYSF